MRVWIIQGMLVPASQVIHAVPSLSLYDQGIVNSTSLLSKKESDEHVWFDLDPRFDTRAPRHFLSKRFARKQQLPRCFDRAQPFRRLHDTDLPYGLRLGKFRRRSSQFCFSATNPSHSM